MSQAQGLPRAVFLWFSGTPNCLRVQLKPVVVHVLVSPSAKHKDRDSLRSHTQRNGSFCTQAGDKEEHALCFLHSRLAKGACSDNAAESPGTSHGRISPTDTRSGGQEARAYGATAPSPHSSHIQPAHSTVYTEGTTELTVRTSLVEQSAFPPLAASQHPSDWRLGEEEGRHEARLLSVA